MSASGVSKETVHFHLDNAPTHTSSSAVAKLHELMSATSCDTWTVFTSFIPLWLFLFWNLKHWLARKRFISNMEATAETNGYFAQLEKLHYTEGIEKLECCWSNTQFHKSLLIFLLMDHLLTGNIIFISHYLNNHFTNAWLDPISKTLINTTMLPWCVNFDSDRLKIFLNHELPVGWSFCFMIFYVLTVFVCFTYHCSFYLFYSCYQGYSHVTSVLQKLELTFFVKPTVFYKL